MILIKRKVCSKQHNFQSNVPDILLLNTSVGNLLFELTMAVPFNLTLIQTMMSLWLLAVRMLTRAKFLWQV